MALDLSTPKSPPSKAAPKTTAKPGVAKDVDSVKNTRMATCIETAEAGAGILALFGFHADAGLIMMHGAAMADVAVSIGDEHEKVGDAIDILGKNSIWTKIIGVAMVVGAQVGVNHGLLKPERFVSAGVVSKATLEAMSKSKLAELEIQARLQAQANEKRLADLERQARELLSPEVIDGEMVDAR